MGYSINSIQVKKKKKKRPETKTGDVLGGKGFAMKCEDGSSDPHTKAKSWAGKVAACNPSTRVAEVGSAGQAG